MKPVYYTVYAYRWGEKARHSYPVGLYSKKHAALKAADAEAESRGGKYECEVIEWLPDGKNEDGTPRMPHKIIKSLPLMNMLKAENMCHSCRVSNGWKRKDRASHTARVKFCEKCGEKKAILPLRHYSQ
jgi:hypothetical protein